MNDEFPSAPSPSEPNQPPAEGTEQQPDPHRHALSFLPYGRLQALGISNPEALENKAKLGEDATNRQEFAQSIGPTLFQEEGLDPVTGLLPPSEGGARTAPMNDSQEPGSQNPEEGR